MSLTIVLQWKTAICMLYQAKSIRLSNSAAAEGEWSCSQYSESGLCVLDFEMPQFRKEDSSSEIFKASVWAL